MHRVMIVLLAVAVTIPIIVKSRPSAMKSVPAAFSVMSSARGFVRVSGDVRHSGIYTITANGVTRSVILMADPGPAPTGYLPRGCEALILKNGSDIKVTITPDGSARVNFWSLPTAQRLVLGIPLDINGMNESDFDRVPGIGPVLARRIVEYRHFNGGLMEVRDLNCIEGIGEKKYEQLKKYFN